MDKLVKAQLEVSERRTALAGLLDSETPDLDAIETAKHAVTDAEKRMQAVMVAEGGNEPVERTTGQPADAEARELVELRERVSLGPYVAAAMAGRSHHGRPGTRIQRTSWTTCKLLPAGTSGGRAGNEGRTGWRRGR